MHIKLFLTTVAFLVVPLFAFAAPAISNVRVLSTSSNSAVIAWDTDTASTTEVEYGVVSVNESAMPTNYTPQTGHTATLQNLLPSTNYKFIVKSTDSGGERAVSTEYTFSTLAGSTTNTTSSPTLEAAKGPVISKIETSPKDTSAVITWTTDVPSDSYPEYGLSNTYGSFSKHDYTSAASHSILLEGLLPETEYHFKIKITGLNGIPSSSDDKTFVTLKKSTTPEAKASEVPIVTQPLIAQPLPQPVPEKIILPYGVKEGQVIKFKKSPAIYLVKPSGLYPFANMKDYNAYIKKTKQRLRIFNGDGSPYTRRAGPAYI